MIPADLSCLPPTSYHKARFVCHCQPTREQTKNWSECKNSQNKAQNAVRYRVPFSFHDTDRIMTTSTAPETNPPDLSKKLPPLIPRRRKASAPEQSLEPAPETPELPPAPQDGLLSFHIPTRRILTPNDMELFTKSPTYSLILAFVFGVSDSVRQEKMRSVAVEKQPAIVTGIISVLDSADDLLKQNPALDTGSRFGNPAFRTYLKAVSTHMDEWQTRIGVPKSAMSEVATYLEQSLGSAQRIDYGSGHELNFFLWLLCLNRLSLLPSTSFRALALLVFPRYLKLVRDIQSTYYLEPAGSHGVWGLDDYQFLPFLFGAAQLVNHPYVTPRSIHSAATVEECAPDYLYLDQVAFVNSVKNVDGLRWHSPMLDDISAAKSWSKIEAGMKKMFVREVLGKLPVMQHFLFGSLVPAVEGMSSASAAEEQEDEEIDSQEHEHGKSWSDCCGIKVPSHLGAAGEMKKRMGSEGLRRIPFD
jgi:serine/threonine-protein phosphatase 2A activator